MQKRIFIYFILLIFLVGEKGISSPFITIPPQNVLTQNQVDEKNKELINSEQLFKTNPNQALKTVEDILIFTIQKLKVSLPTKSIVSDNNNTQNPITACTILQAKAYSVLGTFNEEKNLFHPAIKNYLQAESIYSKLLKTQIPFGLKEKLAQVYFKNKDYSKSLDVYFQIHADLKLELNANKLVETKNKMAELFYILGHEAKAEKFHYEALSIAEDNGFSRQVKETNLLIHALSEKQMENRERNSFLKKSQTISNALGKINRDHKEYSRHIQVSEDSSLVQPIKQQHNVLSIISENKNLEALTDNQRELAAQFNKLNEINKSISILKNRISYSRKTKSWERMAKGLLDLSKLYETNGNIEMALTSYKSFQSIQDSIFNQKLREKDEVETFSDELKLVQSKLEYLEGDKALKQKTIELLQQEDLLHRAVIERKNKTTLYLTLGLVFLLIIALSFIKLNRSRKRANKLLELKSLRTQMNPHFIFNSLNSVNNFISKSDERAANRYIADFSKLLRRVLEYSQDDLITLDLEFEIIELYLKLEHTRFKDKFDYTIEIDPDIDLQMVKIPPMLLQPFIENSIWHGLRYKDEKGELKIRLTEDDKSYAITISDNGIGRTKSSALKTKNQKTHKSMALNNINARLDFIRTLFSTKLLVDITDGENGEGTIVTVNVIK